jgi:hypothetical protein
MHNLHAPAVLHEACSDVISIFWMAENANGKIDHFRDIDVSRRMLLKMI